MNLTLTSVCCLLPLLQVRNTATSMADEEEGDVFQEARESFEEGASQQQQHSAALAAPTAAAQQAAQPTCAKARPISSPGGIRWIGVTMAGLSALLLVLLILFGSSTAGVSTSTATTGAGPFAAVSGLHSLGFCPARWNSTTAGYTAALCSTAAAAAQAPVYPSFDALGVCPAAWNATAVSTTAAAAAQVHASAVFTPLLPQQCLGASSLEWTCGLPAEPSLTHMMHVMQHLQLAGNSSFVQLTSNSSSSSTNSSSLLRVPGQPSSMLGLTCGLPDSASFMYLVQQQQLVGDSSTLHLRGNTSSSAVLQEQQEVVQVEASQPSRQCPPLWPKAHPAAHS
jgi:hypothetical protein